MKNNTLKHRGCVFKLTKCVKQIFKFTNKTKKLHERVGFILGTSHNYSGKQEDIVVLKSTCALDISMA